MKEFNAGDVLSLCKRRGFIYPAYEIYGGIAGLYDYGPLGTQMKTNLIDLWRSIYVLEEGFVEIDSDIVGPEIVFKASGHAENFQDLMVSCSSCGEAYRADHLAKEVHSNPGALSKRELQELLREKGICCPSCKGALSDVEEFNLMFKTKIGPGSGRTGYLRPETAQGIFVNYPNLYRYMRERLPFGVVQIGRAYRNEISPRQGVIRLREFNQMEAELFIDPADKSWPRFKEVRDFKIRLVPNTDEQEVEMTIGEAVDKRIIAHETIAYFLYVTQRFLVKAGVDPKRLRFRQHLKTEMAHYAADCWDAEALLSYGWTEIVGIADRGCWDLSRHIQYSQADLTAFKRFERPIEVERKVFKPKYGLLGPEFKARSAKVGKALETVDFSMLKDGKVEVEVDGEKVSVPEKYFDIVLVKEKVNGEKVIPHVIEPSHGLDRILFTCLEHAYTCDDDGYVRLRLSSTAAPIKVGVFPLMAKDGLDAKAIEIDRLLRGHGIMTYYDDSGTIGRRYARMDEIGTPLCVTVDYEVFENDTVTVRDRDTSEQVRVAMKEIVETISKMLVNKAS
ncbi:MAG: glycine--tRNA ligase [Methanomassiliicoccales archaeon]|nr:MAG: glycine--tRNA ligase [Methanomassiliicoccales archaeon]